MQSTTSKAGTAHRLSGKPEAFGGQEVELRREEGATRPAAGLIALIAGAKLVLHVALSGRYGYFRDELYFLDCGRHLSWGYVDHAPMIGVLARIALLLGGGSSLHPLRIISAVAGALLVALTMLIAWRLGGGRYAQALAGIAVLFVPIYLALDSILSMNAFEPLFWMGCVYVLIRIVQTGNSRLWVWFGVLAGLGLMNKHSTAFFGLAVVAGLLLTPLRREFLKPWIWIGGGLALAIFSPNLIWQVVHHFPTLEDLRNAQAKNVVLSPLGFVKEQIMAMHPLLFPVWLIGLRRFAMAWGRRYRVLAWTFLVFFATMMLLHGKNYYVVPIYPMLLAGGAVAIEAWFGRLETAGGRMPARILQAAVMVAIVGTGAVIAPTVLPLLSPGKYVWYAQTMHLMPTKTETAHRGQLPQLFGDQFGWESEVADVARVYQSLPPAQRARTAILGGNYGETGAINLYGAKYGLPKAISGHQSYSLWGFNGFDGDTVITIQYGPGHLSRMCSTFQKAAEHHDDWGMEEENTDIYVCQLNAPMAVLWERQKHWN